VLAISKDRKFIVETLSLTDVELVCECTSLYGLLPYVVFTQA
jgi:hypothetical protein